MSVPIRVMRYTLFKKAGARTRESIIEPDYDYDYWDDRDNDDDDDDDDYDDDDDEYDDKDDDEDYDEVDDEDDDRDDDDVLEYAHPKPIMSPISRTTGTVTRKPRKPTTTTTITTTTTTTATTTTSIPSTIAPIFEETTEKKGPKASPEKMTKEEGKEQEEEEEEVISDIKVIPTIKDSQLITTMVASVTGVPTEESTPKRRSTTKMEAAGQLFLYGREDGPWTKPTSHPFVEEQTPIAVRANRAHNMRLTYVAKRVKTKDERQSRIEEQDAAWMGHEIIDPVIARTVPKFIYDEPKIPIRDTKCSKFRSLFNRKPPGFKMLIRPAIKDQRRKPPFVVPTVVAGL